MADAEESATAPEVVIEPEAQTTAAEPEASAVPVEADPAPAFDDQLNALFAAAAAATEQSEAAADEPTKVAPAIAIETQTTEAEAEADGVPLDATADVDGEPEDSLDGEPTEDVDGEALVNTNGKREALPDQDSVADGQLRSKKAARERGDQSDIPLHLRTKIYIGGLPPDCRTSDLQDCFSEFGRIKLIELKTGYGFVEFDEPKAAGAAVVKYNEGRFMGQTIRVQITRPRSDLKPSKAESKARDGPSNRQRRRSPPPRRRSLSPPPRRSDPALLKRLGPDPRDSRAPPRSSDPRDLPPTPRYDDRDTRYGPPRDDRYPPARDPRDDRGRDRDLRSSRDRDPYGRPSDSRRPDPRDYPPALDSYSSRGGRSPPPGAHYSSSRPLYDDYRTGPPPGLPLPLPPAGYAAPPPPGLYPGDPYYPVYDARPPYDDPRAPLPASSRDSRGPPPTPYYPPPSPATALPRAPYPEDYSRYGPPPPAAAPPYGPASSYPPGYGPPPAADPYARVPSGPSAAPRGLDDRYNSREAYSPGASSRAYDPSDPSGRGPRRRSPSPPRRPQYAGSVEAPPRAGGYPGSSRR